MLEATLSTNAVLEVKFVRLLSFRVHFFGSNDKKVQVAADNIREVKQAPSGHLKTQAQIMEN